MNLRVQLNYLPQSLESPIQILMNLQLKIGELEFEPLEGSSATKLKCIKFGPFVNFFLSCKENIRTLVACLVSLQVW